MLPDGAVDDMSAECKDVMTCFLCLSSDIWSAGCVLAELLLGQPIFPGDSGVDQLVEIIKVWKCVCFWNDLLVIKDQMWAIKCSCRLLRAQSTSHRNSTVTFSLRLYSTLLYDRFIYRINMNPCKSFPPGVGYAYTRTDPRDEPKLHRV